MRARSGSVGALGRLDALRRAGARLGGPRDWKEWLHFVVRAPDLHLIVNFSVVDDLRAPAGGPAEEARVILLARADGWSGATARVDELRVAGEGLDARFGAGRAALIEGVFHVRAAHGAIEVDLTLTPRSPPLLATNLTLAPDRTLSWLFVPRLEANGRARVGDREFQIAGAEAYHDHNWGRFLWGDDFAWDWLSTLPAAGSAPWSVVAMRLMDRARDRVRAQTLFVYEGDRMVGLFRDDDVRFEAEGVASGRVGLTLPPVMALAAPGAAADVPASLTVIGRRRGEELRVRFTSRDRARVVVPDERTSAGATALHEVSGETVVSGRCGGRAVDARGAGLLEIVAGLRGDDEPAPPAAVRGEAGGRVARSLLRSLRLLAAEQPDALGRLCARLAGDRIALAVDDEHVVVAFDAGGVEVGAPPGPASTRVATDRRTILDVLDGRADLAAAVRAGGLRVQGSLGAVRRAHAGLRAYVEGAVRAPSFPSLLDAFRRDA